MVSATQETENTYAHIASGKHLTIDIPHSIYFHESNNIEQIFILKGASCY